MPFDPAAQKWDTYPFMDKLEQGPSPTPNEATRYLQGALNYLKFPDASGKSLLVDGQFGKKTGEAVLRFQKLRGLALTGTANKQTWDLLDDLAFNLWFQAPKKIRIPKPNDTAINAQGCNRYTDQPVNEYGLTRDADRLHYALNTNVPGPTKQNYAVARKIGHSNDPGAPLSDHARGEALDLMIPGFDAHSGISVTDIAYGRSVMAYLVAHSGGPLQKGLREKQFRGPWRLEYVLFNSMIWYASEQKGIFVPTPFQGSFANDADWAKFAKANGIRPLDPKTEDKHLDHVHASIVPQDRIAK